MNDFLSEIDRRLAMPIEDVSGSHFPQLTDSDHVVGVCSQRVKVIHSMVSELTEKLDDYYTCLEGESMDSKSERHMKWRGEVYLLERKIKLLENLLVVFIHEDVPELVTKKHIVIRHGWQLCYIDESKIEEALKQASDIVTGVILSGLMTKDKDAGDGFGNN